MKGLDKGKMPDVKVNWVSRRICQLWVIMFAFMMFIAYLEPTEDKTVHAVFTTYCTSFMFVSLVNSTLAGPCSIEAYKILKVLKVLFATTTSVICVSFMCLGELTRSFLSLYNLVGFILLTAVLTMLHTLGSNFTTTCAYLWGE